MRTMRMSSGLRELVARFGMPGRTDAIVLRPVAVEETPPIILETHAGSVLRAEQARLVGDRLEVTADGLGVASFSLVEIKSLTRTSESSSR